MRLTPLTWAEISALSDRTRTLPGEYCCILCGKPVMNRYFRRDSAGRHLCTKHFDAWLQETSLTYEEWITQQVALPMCTAYQDQDEEHAAC